MIRAALLTLLVLFHPAVFAHKLAPSLLEIEGISDTEYSVLWRTPASAGPVRPEPALPSGCSLRDKTMRSAGTSIESRWLMTCPKGLPGQSVQVHGLTASRTAVLVKISLADGRRYSELISRDAQIYSIPAKSSTLNVIGQYLLLGIEHILIGFDHLLFVAGLFLLAATWRQLLVTITAFTVGHSFTLVSVSLKIIPDMGAWVEFAIAATILYLAMELCYRKPESRASSLRWPLIAAFGLIHGLGFASVLNELGLPQGDLFAGLLSFNVGIELGQILFVGLLAALLRLLSTYSSAMEISFRDMGVYAMGVMSVFWCLDRAYAMLLSSYYFY